MCIILVGLYVLGNDLLLLHFLTSALDLSTMFLCYNDYVCVMWLSSGCTLCLGKSFFHFNHPEEANHMKNMLPEKTAGPALSLSTGE